MQSNTQVANDVTKMDITKMDITVTYLLCITWRSVLTQKMKVTILIAEFKVI